MSIVSDGTLRKFASLVVVGAASMATMASGTSIIDEWSSVQVPPPPALKPVTIDRGTTALLLLDFNKQTCNAERRPRCIASIPQVAKLLRAARTAGVPVFYSLGGGGAAADILKEVTPTKDEPVVSAGLDKFVGTELEPMLKQKGIKTVIIAGTAAHGAVLYTATGAAVRKLQVILPLDAVSGDNAYTEQYTAWHLVNAPRIDTATTLTTIDEVKF
ncbi:MAG TPA: cysteine hydrolase [Casimicrobiaceae bacterium]|nr:cysteine hydrolase [Casimicrobiaceae bacterium]